LPAALAFDKTGEPPPYILSQLPYTLSQLHSQIYVQQNKTKKDCTKIAREQNKYIEPPPKKITH
jgi:hypothetical protein